MQGFCQYNRGSASNLRSYTSISSYGAATFTAGVFGNRQSSVSSGSLMSRSIGGTANDWFMAAVSGDGTTMRAQWKFADNTSQTITDSSSNQASRWYHWMMSWDGTTQKLWRDGVVVASASPASKTQGDSGLSLELGARDFPATSGGDFFMADFFYMSGTPTAAEAMLIATGARLPSQIYSQKTLLIYDHLDGMCRDIVTNAGVDSGLLVYPQTRPPQLQRWVNRRRRLDLFAGAASAPPPPSTNSNFFFAAA